ncbi:uncharacterized protein LOC116516702 [Thamnophis elegans]|uniref:uncharacterized protein LOC116516702 n=1 Tax=Thamnophis elegans TaxID=35005 RepID=UPI0013776969|nr:uncharacterized protein LOC116516702 [Thamnophis elegans]
MHGRGGGERSSKAAPPMHACMHCISACMQPRSLLACVGFQSQPCQKKGGGEAQLPILTCQDRLARVRQLDFAGRGCGGQAAGSGEGADEARGRRGGRHRGCGRKRRRRRRRLVPSKRPAARIYPSGGVIAAAPFLPFPPHGQAGQPGVTARPGSGGAASRGEGGAGWQRARRWRRGCVHTTAPLCTRWKAGGCMERSGRRPPPHQPLGSVHGSGGVAFTRPTHPALQGGGSWWRGRWLCGAGADPNPWEACTGVEGLRSHDLPALHGRGKVVAAWSGVGAASNRLAVCVGVKGLHSHDPRFARRCDPKTSSLGKPPKLGKVLQTRNGGRGGALHTILKNASLPPGSPQN